MSDRASGSAQAVHPWTLDTPLGVEGVQARGVTRQGDPYLPRMMAGVPASVVDLAPGRPAKVGQLTLLMSSRSSSRR
jgi:hypothetical protein